MSCPLLFPGRVETELVSCFRHRLAGNGLTRWPVSGRRLTRKRCVLCQSELQLRKFQFGTGQHLTPSGSSGLHLQNNNSVFIHLAKKAGLMASYGILILPQMQVMLNIVVSNTHRRLSHGLLLKATTSCEVHLVRSGTGLPGWATIVFSSATQWPRLL